ncbi:hypothetical protein [Streptomyces specialis]|uniref:hypothetical protein n=1 Tax=Streptomyces specialis TaxID=498367 RepID=UPI000A666C13|nr:hypothetical protein [Streptomyces specialis]
MTDDAEQRYRTEITTTMNAVVRACHHVLMNHTYRAVWTPPDPNASPAELVSTARRDILNRLQYAITQAEAAARTIEADLRSRTRRRDE